MLVRNTISGVVADIPAEKSIGHPWFGKFYVPVTNNKNEVLSRPYMIENGKRVLVDENGKSTGKLVDEPKKTEKKDEE